tara:strand:- start:18 stop:1049 length:1032 start_codon:yes stop_codon:yes gene_type:complete
MTNIPDLRDQAEVFDGNTVFDNVFILDTLEYDFKKSGTIEISNLQVVGVTTFAGDISVDEITVRNVDVTGIATVNTNLYVKGTILDSSGDAGVSGQLLSSTGTGTNWIAANTTSVANAINVGVNEVSDNAEKFVSFFSGSTGNLPNQVDAGLKYNPSTNLLTTTVTTAQVAQNLTGTPSISVNAITASGSVTANSFIGDGSNLTNIQAGQVVGNSIFVQGMIIMWNSTVATIPTGFVLCDGSNGTPDLRGRFVVGHHPNNNDYDINDTGGSESVTLTVAQMPSHKHDTTFDNKKYFPGGGSTSISFGGAGGYPADTFSMSNEGGGQSHENRPPYYALCYIMKT